MKPEKHDYSEDAIEEQTILSKKLMEALNEVYELKDKILDLKEENLKLKEEVFNLKNAKEPATIPYIPYVPSTPISPYSPWTVIYGTLPTEITKTLGHEKETYKTIH